MYEQKTKNDDVQSPVDSDAAVGLSALSYKSLSKPCLCPHKSTKYVDMYEIYNWNCEQYRVLKSEDMINRQQKY